MSVFTFPSRGTLPINKKVTGSSATTIVDASTAAVQVAWFQVNENAGATPNLTVDLYDVANTTSYFLSDSLAAPKVWNITAVTAKQGVLFSEGYVVPLGWKLRVTSSDAAGKFDVIGVQVAGY